MKVRGFLVAVFWVLSGVNGCWALWLNGLNCRIEVSDSRSFGAESLGV